MVFTMKIRPATLRNMVEDMKTMFASRTGADRDSLMQLPDSYVAYMLWDEIVGDRTSTDDHPRFRNRIRVLIYVPHFEMYPDQTDDRTLKPALLLAWREIKAIYMNAVLKPGPVESSTIGEIQ